MSFFKLLMLSTPSSSHVKSMVVLHSADLKSIVDSKYQKYCECNIFLVVGNSFATTFAVFE